MINAHVIKDKNIIQRRYILYVDVILEEGDISLGQKITSFFGQIGIFENTEKIVYLIDYYIKAWTLENLLSSDADLEQASEYYEEEDFEEDCVIFIPMNLIFFYGDKKVDFFVYSAWKKNLYLNNSKLFYIKKYLTKKIYTNYFLSKLNSLYDVLNYNKKIINVINFSKSRKNVLKVIENRSFHVLLDRHKFKTQIDAYTNYIFKKKKRIKSIKALKIKNKRMFLKFINIIKRLDVNFSLCVLQFKVSFMDNMFDDKFFLSNYITLLSQLYVFKGNLFKRFRRRKKFKKKILKNSLGKKYFFLKLVNYEPKEDKKKRRRR